MNKKNIAALVMAITTIVVLVIPNIGYTILDHRNILLGGANILIAASAYTLLLSLSQKVGRTVLWLGLLMIFCGVQTVLLFLYGAEPIGVDMYLSMMSTNTKETSELLGNLGNALLTALLLYLPLIGVAVVACARKWRLPEKALRVMRKIGVAILAAALLCLGSGMVFDRDYQPWKVIFPLDAFTNLILAGYRYAETYAYPQTSADFSFGAQATHPDSISETYVVVIGETSRADNWHLLGYGRKTSPGLDSEKNLTAFHRALSQSNTTHKSVPMLLSHLDATNFGDSICSAKSMVTAFNEAGFETWFISSQTRNGSILEAFCEEADSCIFIRDKHPDAIDGDLLPLFDKAMASQARKKLIILHTYGSHFNYADRYPPEFATFKPYRARTDASNRPVLLNSYDNTILYTDYLLTQVIGKTKASSDVCAMIYTSDHGEDIFDDDRHLFLHTSPSPSFYQLHVPLFVWLSDEYISRYPDKAANIKVNSGKFVSSSSSLFNTTVDVAGITTPYFKPGQSVVSASYAEPVALYLNDYNEGVPLRRSGLKQQDFSRLDSLGIHY